MDLAQFFVALVALSIVAVIVLVRLINISIARWMASLPQVLGQATEEIKLPKIKLMDALGYGLFQILSNKDVQQSVAGWIQQQFQNMGKQGGPP